MAANRAHDRPVTVRKYGNRRLYRTDESRYVTLDELAQLVRDGVDFKVCDAKTGGDLTGVVLAQVILEEEKGSTGTPLPVDLLRQLIRLRDDALSDFIIHHLPRLIDIYLEARAAVGESLDMAVGTQVDAGEAALISQLSAVKVQLEQILDSLEIEEVDGED